MIRLALSLLLVTACVDETNLGNVRSTLPFTPSVRWAASFDQGGSSSMWALAMDSSGDVVAAGNIWGQDEPVVNGDQVTTTFGSVTTFITKRSASDGTERWTVRVHKEPHRDLELHGMAIDADDNIVVTGSYGGTVDFGGQSLTTGAQSPADTFVAKYSPTGSLIWVRGLSTTAHSIGESLEIDDSGNIYVSGTFTYFGGALTLAGEAHAPPAPGENSLSFLLALDAGGADLWGRTFEAFVEDIAIAINGDVILTGMFDHPTSVGGAILSPAGYLDTFVSRFRRDGVFVASRGLGREERQPYDQALVDAGGSILLRTFRPGSADRIVALDDSLDDLWNVDTTYTAFTLAGDATVGARIDMSAGTLDLSRIEAGGVATTVSIGTLITASDRGSGLLRGATHPSGALAFGGEHNGTFDFGTGPITGYDDMLIVVVDPASDPVLTAN